MVVHIVVGRPFARAAMPRMLECAYLSSAQRCGVVVMSLDVSLSGSLRIELEPFSISGDVPFGASRLSKLDQLIAITIDT